MAVMSAHEDILQQSIIKALGVKPFIDPETEVRDRIDYLVRTLEETGANGLVLGISGGQDSTLAGTLAQRACQQAGKEFYAVRLPHGTQADTADAEVALDFIKPDHRIDVDIAPAVAALAADLEELGPLSDFNRGNIKARIRMVAQYAIAGERGLLVLGTDHAAENLTGFFTKWGDGAADLLPLEGLNKRQGAALLRHLGAPESTWQKVPTADLEDDQPGLPDEQALGLRYETIDDYLEGKAVPAPQRERIEYLWHRGAHKRHMPGGIVTQPR